MKNFTKLHNKAKKIIPGVFNYWEKDQKCMYQVEAGQHITQKLKE